MTGDTLLSLYRLHSNLRRIAGAFRAYPGLVDAPCEDTVTALCGLPIATVTRPEAIGICIAYQNRTGPSWVGPASNDGPDTKTCFLTPLLFIYGGPCGRRFC